MLKMLCLALIASAMSIGDANAQQRYNEDGTPYTGDNDNRQRYNEDGTPYDGTPKPVVNETDKSKSNSANNSDVKARGDSSKASNSDQYKAQKAAEAEAKKKVLRDTYSYMLQTRPKSTQDRIEKHKTLQRTVSSYNDLLDAQDSGNIKALDEALKKVDKVQKDNLRSLILQRLGR